MSTQANAIAVGRWLKNDFAEWFIGSWAKIIAWSIITIIFLSFLQTDGFFSRGLGEGSGVDPNLFMYIGWMFRCFAAVFLVLAVKLTASGLPAEARMMRLIGLFCTLIVIAHAMGFGLKALDGKRTAALATVEVAETVTQSYADQIAALDRQAADIRADLATRVAPLNAEITRLDTDGKRNEELATIQKERRKELEDAAQVKLDAIDTAKLALTVNSGDHKAGAIESTVKAEKWAPLFVGIAMLATWSQTPDDFAIWLCGVGFLMCWILLGDSIVILVPPILYKLHLKDAQRQKMAAMGAKGGRTTARRSRVNSKLKAIEDLRQERAAAETVEIEDEETEDMEPEAGDEVNDDGDDDSSEDEREGQDPDQAVGRAAA